MIWSLAIHHVCVGSTNITLPCASAPVWMRDRQTKGEEKRRCMGEGKQLFEVREPTVELVDQEETCFHWSEPIHKGAVKHSSGLGL